VSTDGAGQHAGGSDQAPVKAPGPARQSSIDARKQNVAVIRELICTVDDIPVGQWMSKEKQDAICETLTRQLTKGSSVVHFVVTEEHMNILSRHMARQRYGAAVILIEGLVDEMAAMLGS
jgi:hypothetical protein